MAISFALIFIIPFAKAIDIDFSCPGIAELNQEFNVTIRADAGAEYDVKIFVHNSSDKSVQRAEINSEIMNDGKWASPWNYLLLAFPEKDVFLIRANEKSDVQQICLRMRKSGTSNFYEMCKPIEILSSSAQSNMPNNSHGAEQLSNSVSTNQGIFRASLLISFVALIFISFLVLMLRRLQR